MPDQDQVVWPEDPIEADTRAAEAEPEPAPAAKPVEPAWPATFEEALRDAQAASGPAASPPAPQPATAATVPPAGDDEHPTQPSMPAIQAKTEPPTPAPEAAKTVPPVARTEPPIAAIGEADEAPTSAFKTPLPAPTQVPAPNGGQPVVADTAPPASRADTQPAIEATMIAPPPKPALEPEPDSVPLPEAEPVGEQESVPLPEAEPVGEQEFVPLPEAEPAKAAEPEPEPEPAPAAAAAAEAAAEPAPGPEPVMAAEPPAPEAKEDEWIPLPVNPPVPSWAPKIGAAQPAEEKVDWPGGTRLPSWAPVGGGRPTQNVPAQPQPRQSMPVGEALPQARPGTSVPAAASTPQPQPASHPQAGSRPPAESKPKTSSWEIVPPKVSEQKAAYAGPSPEDRSYAEWFAWAKRSGAPATACHAAAQGAFRALSAGHDMNTAVTWATAAMSQPPGLVSASRQLYCAWYSLGNIDLRLQSPQAHAFAAAAIAALEGGADAPTAHQAGLAAAGAVG